MSEDHALGPDPRKLYTYQELPIGANAVGLPALHRNTGLWRYLKPSMRELLPPCQDACPLGNWIPRFIEKVREGDLEEAWQALKLENPFPGVCGRVCHHPCEASCNRKELDGATSVQHIERYLAEHFFDKKVKPAPTLEKQGKKTVVVGGGPAGLACAYFLKIMGYEVTLIEAAEALGGIPQFAIPAYRLPRYILNKEIQDILSVGLELRTACRVGQDMPFSQLLEYDAVFLATGAHREAVLDMAPYHMEGVYSGLDFLTRMQRTESIGIGRKVIIIGGGNSAVDAAMSAVRLGAEEVTMVCLESRNEMPAWEYEVQEAAEEGIRIINGLGPNRFFHTDGRISRIEFKRCTAVFDDRGTFNPQYDEAALTTLDANTVVVAVGQAPDVSFLAGGEVALNPRGGVAVDSITLQTSIEHVFAGGDVIDQPWTVSNAVGSAKRAAIAVDYYLKGKDLGDLARKGALSWTMRGHLGLDDRAVPHEERVAQYQDLNVVYSPLTKNRRPEKRTPQERLRDFNEITRGMDSEEAAIEAERCLSCGVCRMCGNCRLFCPDGAVRLDDRSKRYVIDYDYCKGCGICVNECPTASIALESEGEG